MQQVSVNELLQLIGEQAVQIMLLNREVARLTALVSPPAPPTPPTPPPGPSS